MDNVKLSRYATKELRNQAVKNVSDIWNKEIREDVINRPVKYQASAWIDSGNLYVPFYRQAHIRVFNEKFKVDGKKALDLAYSDIREAFIFYLKNYNDNTPFIIASHSQGTVHAKRIISEFIDGKELQEKLIAAYLVGIKVTEDEFDNIKPMNSPDETGGFVSWNTFKYNKYGRMIQAPGQTNLRLNDNYSFKTDVPHYPIAEKDGWVFLLNKPLYDTNELKLYGSDSIWSEPEANDPEFKKVYLNKLFKQDARTVTENSLDILHISEVHTFGNKKRPLPISDYIERVGEGHWKAVYQYEAGENSIPSKIFGIKTLIVENEFVLPHTTVARVKFGSFVNTIITSALPITHSESILHVKAYRNNLVFNNPILDAIFDYQTTRMMEKTLCEDKCVIDTIYPKYRDGNFITKYDNLVRVYRDEYASMVDKDPTL